MKQISLDFELYQKEISEAALRGYGLCFSHIKAIVNGEDLSIASDSTEEEKDIWGKLIAAFSKDAQ